MDRIFQIAVDGPGGAGKSTVAKAVAKELNIEYIDTGGYVQSPGTEDASPGDGDERRAKA